MEKLREYQRDPGVLSRRNFLISSAVGVTALLSACNEQNSYDPLKVIQELEVNPKPGTLPELVKAVARFYCQETSCFIPADDLIKKVSFVSFEQMRTALEREIGRSFTPQDRIQPAKVLELVSLKEGKILLNTQVINQNIATAKLKNPDFVQSLGRQDFGILLYKSILFHAFSHANQSRENVSLGPLVFADSSLILMNLDGFKFRGIQGGVNQDLSGLNESFTEYAAHFMAAKTGAFIPQPIYWEGVKLVDMVNKQANLTSEEFLEYYQGRKSIVELIKKWASIKNPEGVINQQDYLRALMAMVVIATRVDLPDQVSQTKAEQRVKSFLFP